MSNLGNKEIMAKNINRLMNKKGVTRNKLSDDLEVSYSTISDWINAKTYPRIDKIELMAKYFNVEKSELVEDQDEIKNIIEIDQFIRIPVIGTIACGEPITADENIDYYKTMPKTSLPNGELFFLVAQGDSMKPIIMDASLVLCRRQDDVENGEIAAVLLNGDEEATLKRVRKGNNFLMLEAINEEYEPYLVDKSNPARIIGRAMQVVNKL